jgi:hypothetical protein
MLEGRTENQVKNRYKSLKKKIVDVGENNEISCIKAYLQL